MAKSASARPKVFLNNQTTKEPETLVEVYDFLTGLWTDKDPGQIPNNALIVSNNVSYTREMLFRRNGLNPWAISKPNSLQVQGVFPFFENTTGLNLLRFTPSTVHKYTSSGWVNFPPSAIAANSGSNQDYFSFGVIDNRGFFSNEGIDPIREIDAPAHTYKAVGNAPRYKYITTAFNRIIGVNLRDAIGGDVPYQVGWCGESNYGEWNPLVDISAGSENLTSSPTTITDDCTGVFSTGNLLIITRQQSIWLGTHTPSGTTPFAFFSQLPHIGADLPRTICLTDYGLVWVSNQTSSVYLWIPGTPVTDLSQIIISKKISRLLRMKLNQADQTWASYNQEAKTWTLFISNINNSTVDEFEYNFSEKTWNTGTWGGGLTSIVDVNYSNSTLTIDDLTGTINALLGTIDSLGGLRQNTTRIFGYSNGDLNTQQLYSGLPEEVGNIVLTDNGSSFETIIATKIFEGPPDDVYTTLVRALIYPFSTGTIYLEYSKNEGATWVTAKTKVFSTLARQQYIQMKRTRRFRRFIWRVRTSDCMFAMVGFVIKVVRGGVSNSE